MSDNLKKDMFKVIGEIAVVAADISENTEHDVFVYIVGHIKKVDIDFHIGGWDSNKEPIKDAFYFKEIFLDDKELKKARSILDTLRKLLKNGKVNFDRLDYETEEIKHYSLSCSNSRNKATNQSV